MTLDERLFLAINNGLSSGLNDLWLANATWLGNGWVAFPIAVVLIVWQAREHARRNLTTLALAGIVGGIVLNLVKQVAHTERPLAHFAQAIAAGQVTVHVVFERLYQNSFPSGHTQTAFTVATVLMYVFRDRSIWLRLALIAIACIIGLSRIYVGAHFPSDVLAGAALGYGTATLCVRAGERWGERAG